MKTNKKVAILALVLLVLAGIVVVIFKGFNVSLMLRQHESVDIVIGTKFDIKDVKEICKNTFQDKKYVVRTIEVFSDAVNINVESMTDEEKQKLVQGFNERYNLELDVQELTIKSNSNVRIRDMVNPYLVPCFVSMVVITIYLIIRFRKLNAVKLLGKLYGLLIITLAVIGSVVAIIRIPFSSIIVNFMAVVCIVEIVIYTSYLEKNYSKLAFENAKKLK